MCTNLYRVWYGDIGHVLCVCRLHVAMRCVLIELYSFCFCNKINTAWVSNRHLSCLGFWFHKCRSSWSRNLVSSDTRSMAGNKIDSDLCFFDVPYHNPQSSTSQSRTDSFRNRYDGCMGRTILLCSQPLERCLPLHEIKRVRQSEKI